MEKEEKGRLIMVDKVGGDEEIMYKSWQDYSIPHLDYTSVLYMMPFAKTI